MRKFIQFLFCLFMTNTLYAANGTEPTSASAESNVYDSADIEQQNIDPDLVPQPATPGESVEGRTEFTTPQQNKEIYNEYENLQHESSDASTQ